MPIKINTGMLNQIVEDSDDGWDDGDNNITYSVGVDPGSYDYDPLGDPFTTIPVEETDNQAIQQALTLWDDVMSRNLAYSHRNDDADIIINLAKGFKPGVGGTTYSTLHDIILPDDADVFLPDNRIVMGNFAWQTVLHEFGHALGLQHPGDYDASDGTFTYQNDRTYDEDTVQFSLMSYFEPVNYNKNINWNVETGPQTPMVYDILAIQQYYGVDTTTRTGNTTYGFNSTAERSVFNFDVDVNNKPVVTIWDAGGIDTLDLSGYGAEQRVYLEAGSYSDVGGLVQNLGIAFGAQIENAIGGSGKDVLVGNALENTLKGLAGDDSLNGGDGDDTLDGGKGSDRLSGGAGSDILKGGEGGDVLYGGAGFDIAQYDAPGGEKITIRAKDAAAGRWIVTGPAEAASDDAGDTLIEIEGFRFGAGNDVIKTAGATATVSFDLDGRAGNDTISGGDGTDTLIGGAGTDILKPGDGVFHVYGGSRGPFGVGIRESLAANDTLVLDHSGQANEYILRFSGPGPTGGIGTFSDTLGSTATGIAHLIYTGGSGTDNISGGIGGDTIEGGKGVDLLYGLAGSDVLRGGLGADYLSGGEGNDRIETGGGSDTAVYGDAGNDTLIGSDDAESMGGGIGADKLYGYGGADYLYGGEGDDTILAGEGDDLVDPGLGIEKLDGGLGNDRLSISRETMTTGVSFFLNGERGSDGTTAKNFEVLAYGSGSGNDTVQGWNNDDIIRS